MPANNLHRPFFAAVMAQFAASPDLAALVPDGLWRYSVPEKNPETGKEVRFPRMIVASLGGETGQTNAGPADQAFFIRMSAAGFDPDLIEQIGWEICAAFDNWNGDYPGIKIRQVMRNEPPAIEAIDETDGYLVSVDFMVNFEGD